MSDKSANYFKLVLAAGFLLLVFVAMHTFFGTSINGGAFLLIAAVVGGYMAMNIGANDVANNVGPAVGSGAMTMGAAIVLAAVFEFGGAVIAGGDVVGTVKSSIIDPELVGDDAAFIWLMLAALLAGAVWLNIATYLGAPVSTTHSIVGGVLGAGIAAGGLGVANWSVLGKIAMSWVISPVMGGAIAAIFLYTILRLVADRENVIDAAKKVVPYLIAIMAWAFATYLAIKGLKKVFPVDFLTATLIGLGAAILVFLVVKPRIAKKAQALPNERESVNYLFATPLIFAAALLSFAHGANDVANAVGPLAAINDALASGGVSAKAAIPLWVMGVGALGIAVGLALFGPKLIRTVGSEITHLDKTRAFCVALAAAITVIIASQLGLPVSSTHIAVGGVFGVGFLREYLEANQKRVLAELGDRIRGDDEEAVKGFIAKFEASAISNQGKLIKKLRKGKFAGLSLAKKDRRKLVSVHKKEVVKRSLVTKIVTAWVITVPASGLMAFVFYFTIRGFMLP
ncbi:MAG: inorganic phosphate transporter [Alphaproteobacteria bacterium]